MNNLSLSFNMKSYTVAYNGNPDDFQGVHGYVFNVHLRKIRHVSFMCELARK